MNVAQLLKDRRANWETLDRTCQALEAGGLRKIPAERLTRFAALYRSACADLALAEAHQVPLETVRYLHELVGRAHNQLYRSRHYDARFWLHELIHELPRRMYQDWALRVASLIFWGVFAASMIGGAVSRPFAERLITPERLEQMQEMYADPDFGRSASDYAAGTAFYIQHNTSIGLRCFGAGLIFGVGGVFACVFNAAQLGAVFGFMSTTPQRDHFFEFVTAHGPFELTAVVLSVAAGMRLGFALVDTKGLARGESLRHTAKETMPMMGAAMVMFGLAALIEGFVSPSTAPYEVKAAVGAGSSGLLMFYFVVLGRMETNVDEI